MKKFIPSFLVVAFITISPPTVIWGQEGEGEVQPYTIDLGDDIIKGRVQKPEAWYILQHANLSYKSLDPKKSFIPELLESVTKNPF